MEQVLGDFANHRHRPGDQQHSAVLNVVHQMLPRSICQPLRLRQKHPFRFAQFRQAVFRHHAQQRVIPVGHHPQQNGRVESFNGRLRDECLNPSWFRTLNDMRDALANWRREYNSERPHSYCTTVISG